MDPELWKVENYRRFLDKRQELLAISANEMLTTLRSGVMPPAASEPPKLQELRVSGEIVIADIEPDNEDEAVILAEANRFVVENELPAGELTYEVYDENTGQFTVLGLAWPDGLRVTVNP